MSESENIEYQGIIQALKEYAYKEDLRLFELAMDLIDKKLYGMASDAIRYNIVEIFGGNNCRSLQQSSGLPNKH